MKNLSPAQLAQWLADPTRPPPRLLDVREPWEHEIGRLPGADAVPMRAVPARLHEFDRAAPVVCICHHGARSAHVAMFLVRQGYTEVYNLTGGVDAWARQIDPAFPTY